MIRTNYLGSVWCLRAFLPGLGEGSHLVNVVSIAGLVRGRALLGLEARAARVLTLGRSRAGRPRDLGAHRQPGPDRDTRLPAAQPRSSTGSTGSSRARSSSPRGSSTRSSTTGGRSSSRAGTGRSPGPRRSPPGSSREPRALAQPGVQLGRGPSPRRRARAGSPGAGRSRRAPPAARRAARRGRAPPRRLPRASLGSIPLARNAPITPASTSPVPGRRQ